MFRFIKNLPDSSVRRLQFFCKSSLSTSSNKDEFFT